MRTLYSQGFQRSGGIVGHVGSSIGRGHFITIADIPMVKRDGTIGTAKYLKLFVPAIPFGGQPRQQQNRPSRVRWTHLAICQFSPINSHERRFRPKHGLSPTMIICLNRTMLLMLSWHQGSREGYPYYTTKNALKTLRV